MRPSTSSSYSGQSSSAEMVNTEREALVAFRRVNKYHLSQIIALALAFVFSTAVCLTLSYVNYKFTPDCILFAQWRGEVQKPPTTNQRFERHSPNRLSDNHTIEHSVDDRISKAALPDTDYIVLSTFDTTWGKKKQCYLTQYGYASAAACAFILCWFFVFFRPTKEAYLFKKKTAASKFIIPSILFCFAFAVCVIVAVITLAMGMSSWCNNVLITSGGRELESCSSVQRYSVVYSTRTVEINYYSFLIAGQVLAWLGALAWISSLAILALRWFWHVDFPDYFFEHSILNNDGFDTDHE